MFLLLQEKLFNYEVFLGPRIRLLGFLLQGCVLEPWECWNWQLGPGLVGIQQGDQGSWLSFYTEHLQHLSHIGNILLGCFWECLSPSELVAHKKLLEMFWSRSEALCKKSEAAVMKRLWYPQSMLYVLWTNVLCETRWEMVI